MSDRIGTAVARVRGVRHVLTSGPAYEAALAAASEQPAAVPDRSGDDLYILYTGGTTGAPKGVMWRHSDIFFAAMGGTPDLAGEDGRPDADRVAERARKGDRRTLPACPFIHGTAHWMALSSLLSGGTVVVAPERQYDPERLLSLIEAEAVSFLVIVGDAFARPLVEVLERQPHRWDLGKLSVIVSGGATLSPTSKERLTALLPSTMIVDGYGTSETGGQASMVTAAGASADTPRFRVNAATAVLDEQCRPVEPGSGTIGRLARRGHIPLGYYNDPVKTEATFPVVDGIRWAIPGDLAEVALDGTVILHGRGSTSINTGGEKVFPEEVESVLKSHPGIRDAVVVGVPSERWGEEVVAVVEVTAEAATAPGCDAFAHHCRDRLAGYKLPRAYVVVEQVRRSPAGKPDYRWAREVAGTRLGAAGRPSPA